MRWRAAFEEGVDFSEDIEARALVFIAEAGKVAPSCPVPHLVNMRQTAALQMMRLLSRGLMADNVTPSAMIDAHQKWTNLQALVLAAEVAREGDSRSPIKTLGGRPRPGETPEQARLRRSAQGVRMGGAA
ncbi:hypothetical protein CFR72_04480 [Gluconacetobacter entanii]|uniref:Uncharacterized protein n=2 Tax=Gluconacetobacter entanii TaxID=108528 RepID=A0A318QDB3_9PROT|nr:hypothetical protein CFR72_04480 [Gluconacetobacter entanii]